MREIYDRNLWGFLQSELRSRRTLVLKEQTINSICTSDKESTCQCRDARDMGSIAGSGRFPEEGNGNPILVFLPGKFHGERRWQATVHGVAKSHTQLNTHTRHIILGCSDPALRL